MGNSTRIALVVAVLAVAVHFGRLVVLNWDCPEKYPYWTPAIELAKDFDPIQGRIYLITGANRGIGLENARALYSRGGTVIMGCRSLDKCELAKKDIQNRTSNEFNGKLKCEALDLSDLNSVRNFAKKIESEYSQLHALILNAGIMALPEFTTSKQGFELQWATNHVAHYYLARLLTPVLAKTPQSRVVSVASQAQDISPNMNAWINLIESSEDKSQATGPLAENYHFMTNYGFSKASNILFAREFHRRYYNTSQIGAISIHPGVIATQLGIHLPQIIQMLAHLIKDYVLRDEESGAATQTLAVLMDYSELDGNYMTDCSKHTEKLIPQLRENRENIDQRLWDITEQLILSRNFPLSLDE